MGRRGMEGEGSVEEEASGQRTHTLDDREYQCVSWESRQREREAPRSGQVGGASHRVDVRPRALARKLGQVCMHAPDAALEWVRNRNGLAEEVREDTKPAARLSKAPPGSHVRVSVADFSQAQ